MRVYEAIVKGLEVVGVDAAFGGAGENAASLMRALKHSTKIKPMIVRYEQAVWFMACGYAIYSNRPSAAGNVKVDNSALRGPGECHAGDQNRSCTD